MSKNKILNTLCLLIMCLVLGKGQLSADENKITWSLGKAPSFREGVEWLNTLKPIKLQDLQGKFVLLDFWTYACINCMHILPDLKKLEEKYPKELVVIGVHSAKFSQERETRNIREAVLRYGITHPVINDNQLRIWRDYGVDAWPTVILIDPLGNIIARHSGEGIFEPMDKVLRTRMADYENVLDRSPLALPAEKDQNEGEVLKFPGKVLVDVPGKRLLIADTGHNRILVAELNGKISAVIGNGKPGREDGDFAKAQFREPQGMALAGDILYIADRANHLIRKADLSQHQVETIAGTGEQGNSTGQALSSELNSPWDLTLTDDTLFIAMAGLHQIWAMDLGNNEIRVFAGTREEDIIDGALGESAFAQPSGLVSNGNNLYVADSEVSAVRQISLAGEGQVSTLIGKGLFEFGDKDGKWPDARLQHPLGITSLGSVLAVADTYNNKIKLVDLIGRTVTTLAGTGEPGFKDGEAKGALFDEPSGLSYGDDKIYVADTNNHRIRVIDLKNKTVSTLALQAPQETKPSGFSSADFLGEKVVLTSAVSSRLERLRLDIELPREYKLLNNAPSQLRLSTASGLLTSFPIQKSKQDFPLNLTVPGQQLFVELSFYYCREGRASVCLIKDVLYEVPIDNNSPLRELPITYQAKTSP